MRAIYEPKGRAREYCELACNLYTGCNHGCFYCYAANSLRKSKEEFHGNVRVRADIIPQIKKDILHISNGAEVHLCFHCDPYAITADGALAPVTRQAIRAIHGGGCAARILTKAGLRSMRDFDLLAGNPTMSYYGATLTAANDKDSLEWEPKAALPEERLAALHVAYARGIRTWASLEPVIDPEQSLGMIHAGFSFIDEFKIGRWNHDKRADKIDWKTYVTSAIDLLRGYNAAYKVKQDLWPFVAESQREFRGDLKY